MLLKYKTKTLNHLQDDRYGKCTTLYMLFFLHLSGWKQKGSGQVMGFEKAAPGPYNTIML